MRLKELLAPDAIRLDLQAETKDELLAEMVGLLTLSPRATETVTELIRRRELLGSTGVGDGVAIPHCRSLLIDRVRLAFGRHMQGVAYDAMDGEPVHFVFLIVAPPVEVSNLYLTVLGKVAQFVRGQDVRSQLAGFADASELYALMEEQGL